jgi:type II secretory pathway pseudopilin PulG
MKEETKQKNNQLKRSGGFSLIEIILAVGILLIIGAITTPIIMSMYNKQENQSVSDEIVTALKKAHSFAMLRKDDSAFGLKFDNENKKFIVFPGETYDELNQDNLEGELYQSTVTLESDSGDNTILFAKGTGYTSSTTISVSLNNYLKTIFICENGLVDYVACE